MRLDCHAHTARHSACSTLSPDALCRLALERGLDALAITEHHFQWSREALDALEQTHPPLKLFAGMELTLAEGHDVVLLAPPALLGPMGLARPFLTLDELAAAVEPVREQVFSFVAHPFRYTCDISPALLDILEWVDGVEENSVNLLRQSVLEEQGQIFPANRECYHRARLRAPRIALYNTDCHREAGVGVLANELDCPVPQDEAGLVQALKSVPIVQWQNREALAALLQPARP